MKNTVFGHLLSVALVGSLLLSGCQKEKTGFLRLNAERLTSNEKTYVDGTTVQWWVGDQVRVNGTEYELVNDNIISGDPIGGNNLLAIYPSSIGTAAALSDDGQVTVTIPSIYTYETVDIGGGSMKQKLAMPMVGVAEGSATSMTMRHLCSAMQITINNSLGEVLVLDSIILRGSGLSGTVTVSNLAADNPTVGAGDVHSVRMAFPGTTIANNGNLTVQIPVLPVSSPCTTWVSVRGHLDDGTAYTAYRYKRSTGIALVRANVHCASVTMSTDDHDHIAEVPSLEGALPGVFSVSATKRVYFSKGNLLATGTTSSSPSGGWDWSFAAYQYFIVGNAAANTAINGNGTISADGTVDLFGWSTASTYYGIHNSKFDTAYNGDFVDWARAYNSANGTSGWRTLTGDEWNYLVFQRTTTSNIRFAKARIFMGNNVYVNGVILLPDDWSTSYHTLARENARGANYTANTIDESTWTNELEAHGAVFLPVGGRRDGANVTYLGNYGTYHSATPSSNTKAYGLNYANNDLQTPFSNNPRHWGHSVRLVKDDN